MLSASPLRSTVWTAPRGGDSPVKRAFVAPKTSKANVDTISERVTVIGRTYAARAGRARREMGPPIASPLCSACPGSSSSSPVFSFIKNGSEVIGCLVVGRCERGDISRCCFRVPVPRAGEN
jgi:hypothetical protein